MATFFQTLTVLDTACWIACFWWMHRISTRQDALLGELREQGARIERLAKEEHNLVKEMHPKISNMEGTVSDMVDAVKGNENAG